jgi:hypothetical protein
VLIADPMSTAAPIFAMKAAAIPSAIGADAYRVASTPVVYSSLSPTISATSTNPNVARKGQDTKGYGRRLL